MSRIVGRVDAEDVAEQRAKARAAADELRAKLLVLGDATGKAHQALAFGAPSVDLSDVHGAASAVRRAEENLDIALLDLATASGQDA